MATPEQNFWRLIRDHLPGHKMRVENTTGPGVPDVNGCWEGHEYWVELKILGIKKPTTETNPWLLLDSTQRLWYTQRRDAGGKVIILVRCINHIRFYPRLSGGYDRNIHEFIIHRPYSWSYFEMVIRNEILR